MTETAPSPRLSSQADTAGDQLLTLLNRLGIEHIFSSPGSEWPPLWEALAKARALSQPAPDFINCRHEVLAASAAVGHYKISGRVPCVALHTTVGLINASMVLRLALHEQIPMLILTGESLSFGERTDVAMGPQWLRSLADVGGPARLAVPWVKWSATLPHEALLSAHLSHAVHVALAVPSGPAVLSLPLENMLAPAVPDAPHAHPMPPPALPSFEAGGAALAQAAEDLLAAERPVILTDAAGRDPSAVPALIELAELIGAPVIQRQPAYTNFPRNHDLHLGYDLGSHARDADLLLLVACKSPVHPPSSLRAGKGKRVISVTEAPEDALVPIGRIASTDVSLVGPLDNTLRRLTLAIREQGRRPDWQDAVADRTASWAAEHRRVEAARAQVPPQDSGPPSAAAALSALEQALPLDAIVVEETTIHKQDVIRMFEGRAEGCFFSRLTGGLGVMFGQALGLKLAAPEKVVVFVVGDGALNYSPVTAALGLAQEAGLPVLTYVLNNGSYASMQKAHTGYFPGGWAERSGQFPGIPIAPVPDYAALGPAFGGFGQKVTSLEELGTALQQCLKELASGRSCVLDVICT